ncbi:unnamed protein product [Moneuplotes crassus]|uniref:Aurora kinase n=1 Tax=Euplotes crassus TaxID=5936 RepID=A0AAD1U526_EUPCR|nr:unnamed protein product [Moneuplotes crassus]
MEPVEIPAEIESNTNHVKNRILFLPQSVLNGEERECRKEDFESMMNSNIGVGGFGKVYKVRHKKSRNIYAIKVINKAKIIQNDLVEQIKLEVRIMYELEHDNIVKLYNHYEDEDNFYLILQFCGKGQLYTLLKKEGRLNEKQTAKYMREIISAVEYLHSLDPPIIHRDIKPENILLDSNDSVKLCDFGWSNFFNDSAKRETYCGTPEYLAPEMIKQKGHNKNLDIWNLGVLFFELLTGRPPFEGKGQQDLFQNILNFKVRWPKGFSGVAKDLVVKLLKSNPDSRIGLSEILEHPWFQAHQPSKPTISKVLIPQKKLDPSGEIEKGKYAVISKPSLKNKIESDSKSKTKLMISSDQPDSVMTRMNKQVRELTDENNELKIQNKMLSKDLENAQKENAELKEAMSKSSLILEDHEDTKLLKSKIHQLEAYKKEVLIDLEDRKKSMRQTETQLEMKENELEMLANTNHTAIEKAENYKIKLDKLEVENEELRTRVQKAERERDQIEMESKNKMEVLQYKLLNKFETDDKQDDTAFDQLLNLCKAELEEILDKVKKKDDEDGDLLSSESLEDSWSQQSKKINQMKTEYEQEIYENLKKIDDLTTEVEEVKRTLHRKYKGDIDEKNKAIVNLRSFETKYQQEVEKNKSYEEQLKDLSDKKKL